MAKKIKTVNVNELLGVETPEDKLPQVETATEQAPDVETATEEDSGKYIIRVGTSYLCEGGFTNLKENAKVFTKPMLDREPLVAGSVVEPLE